jgi:hypothetical protein
LLRLLHSQQTGSLTEILVVVVAAKNDNSCCALRNMRGLLVRAIQKCRGCTVPLDSMVMDEALVAAAAALVVVDRVLYEEAMRKINVFLLSIIKRTN